jgi:tellurium resistance protein TerD
MAINLMGVSLSKGGNISLNKKAPNLKKLLVGLGWNMRATDGQAFDLDASIFILNASNKVRSDADFIFYNQLKSSDGSVEHLGDNRTGEGDGDDERVQIDLTKIPSNVDKLAFSVTIHEAEARRQNFGMVQSAFIRVVNQENDQEIARFDLSEDMSTETAMIFAEVYRHGQEWKFRAVAQGFQGGLAALAKNYGISI